MLFVFFYCRSITCVQRRPLIGTSTRLEAPWDTSLKHLVWIEPSLYRTNEHDYSYLRVLRNKPDIVVKRSRILKGTPWHDIEFIFCF